MAIGLFFFVRASTKDRIEQEKLIAEQEADSLLTQIQQYFTSRSYRITELNREENQITFEGLVRPSWFLAIFLTLLTAVGLLCLGLVLSMAIPNPGKLFWGTGVAFAPGGLVLLERLRASRTGLSQARCRY
jgi:Protein of unknown function (DUF3529).